MKNRLKTMLARFGKDESGSAILIEFVIFVPMFFSIMLMSVEMGLYSVRNMFLERGLDLTVRYVRLHTGEDMKHAQLKQMICDYSGFIDDCSATLRLEMDIIDPRNFSQLDQEPDCVDKSEDPKPEKGLNLGQPHDMMMMRACVKFSPVFPATGIGKAMQKDGAGMVRMIALSAFVQEPS